MVKDLESQKTEFTLIKELDLQQRSKNEVLEKKEKEGNNQITAPKNLDIILRKPDRNTNTQYSSVILDTKKITKH